MKKTITVVSMLCLIALLHMIKAQEVKLNSNLVVEADGTLRMDSSASGNARVWDDLRVSLDNGSDAAVIGSLTNLSGPQIWFFRNNQGVEAMSFQVQLPHSWKQGTRIYPHVHWTPRSTGSGYVRWNLDYTWANYNSTSPETFPPITTSSVNSTENLTINTHLVTYLTPDNVGISGTGKTISSVLICRIWRNSNSDTYNADAGLLFVDFHYEIDTMGSRAEYSK